MFFFLFLFTNFYHGIHHDCRNHHLLFNNHQPNLSFGFCCTTTFLRTCGAQCLLCEVAATARSNSYSRCWRRILAIGRARTSRNAPPVRTKGLIRPYKGKPTIIRPFIRPYFWGGYVRGGRLTSHEGFSFGSRPLSPRNWWMMASIPFVPIELTYIPWN